MKHLIETTNPSGLAITEYDRLILNSTTNDVLVRGGVNANGHPYVDLGLSVKWATMNVGALSETDYGYYFQWGDTVNKSETNCSWLTYKHCNGSQTTLTKYNTSTDYGENPDNKTTLDLEDDAARTHMGGDWRIPTKAEIQELLDNTDKEWIANYNGSGVRVTKFTSTINGNSIFIPLSGRRGGPLTDNKGIYGQLWSSSLDDSFPLHTWGLFCSSSGGSLGGSLGRSDGLTVRGVL